MFRRLGVTALSTVLGSAVALHTADFTQTAYAADQLAYAAQSNSLTLRLSKRPNSQTAGDPSGLAFQVMGASSYSILEMTKDGNAVDASALGVDVATLQTYGLFIWHHSAGDAGSYMVNIGGSYGGNSGNVKVLFKLKPVTFAPTLKAKKSTSVAAGEQATVVLKGSDKDGDDLSYSVTMDGTDSIPAGASTSLVSNKSSKKSAPAFVWQTAAGDYTGGNDGKGIYHFTASVTDGTSTATRAFVIKVKKPKEAKNKAPKFNKLAGLPEYFVGETIEFDVSATDDGLPLGSTLTYTLENAPEGAAIDGTQVTCPADSAGEKKFQIKVSDSKLSSKMYVKAIVNEMPNNNHAPAISGLDGDGVEGDDPYRIKIIAGESVSFQIIAEDEDAEPLHYSVTTTRGAIPEGSTLSEDGNFSWDVANAGVYNLVVKVIDGFGASDTERVIVRASRPGTTPPPVKPHLRIGSHSGGKYYLDEAVEFKAFVTNAVEGEKYEFRLSGAKDCATLTTDDASAVFAAPAGCLTGENPGSVMFTITVKDSKELSDSEDVALVFEDRPVDEPNDPSEKPAFNHAPVFKALKKPVRATVYYSIAEINQLAAEGKVITFQHSEAHDDNDAPETLRYNRTTFVQKGNFDTWVWAGLPGDTYDSASRTWTWLPPASAGTYTIVFVVADSEGRTDSMKFKIVVRAK